MQITWKNKINKKINIFLGKVFFIASHMYFYLVPYVFLLCFIFLLRSIYIFIGFTMYFHWVPNVLLLCLICVFIAFHYVLLLLFTINNTKTYI